MESEQLALILNYIIKDISIARCNILNALGKHRNDEITICDLGDVINKELLDIIKYQEESLVILGIRKRQLGLGYTIQTE